MTSQDLHEHTCIECKNVFYTEWMPELPSEITHPKVCPFCGIQFNYTTPTTEQMI